MNIDNVLRHIIRIGTVTAIDDASGYVQVNFDDRDDAPRDIPMFSLIKEYNMPDIDDPVWCLFIPFAPDGICLGRWFDNEANKPPVNNRNIWHKALRKKGSMSFDDDSETLTINAKNIVFNTGKANFSGEVTIAQNLTVKGELNGFGKATFAIDVIANGISSTTHTHICTAPGSPSGSPQ